jgi:hypothetical protein
MSRVDRTEITVPKNKNLQAKKQPASKSDLGDLTKPWISMRSGLILIAIASVAMAVLTAWQVVPTKGLWEGILWGLLFGGLIWVIFFGNLLITKFFRR